MNQLFASGSQSIGTSASPSVLPMSIEGWFSLELTGLISLLMSLLQHCSEKASVLPGSAFFMVQLSHLYMTTGKTILWAIWTFVSKVMSLLFNTLSRFVIAFLPRGKHLLISWLQSPANCNNIIIKKGNKEQFYNDPLNHRFNINIKSIVQTDRTLLGYWLLFFKVI